MNQIANVVIVMSRCSQRKEGFGIRLEEKARGIWGADWAFPVQERLAKREGYDNATVRGSIGLEPAYPGCPYCKDRGVVLCSRCNKVSCCNTSSTSMTCPWCGMRAQLGGGEVNELHAGGDL